MRDFHGNVQGPTRRPQIVHEVPATLSSTEPCITRFQHPYSWSLDMQVELYMDEMPLTASNWIDLALWHDRSWHVGGGLQFTPNVVAAWHHIRRRPGSMTESTSTVSHEAQVEPHQCPGK